MDEEGEYKVGFLAPQGTFGEDAARIAFQSLNVIFVSFKTNQEVAEAVTKGLVDFSVVP